MGEITAGEVVWCVCSRDCDALTPWCVSVCVRGMGAGIRLDVRIPAVRTEESGPAVPPPEQMRIMGAGEF